MVIGSFIHMPYFALQVCMIASLQALVQRTGFMDQQCESTRRAFATVYYSTGFSDVYDGTLLKDFLTVDQSAFLSECN